MSYLVSTLRILVATLVAYNVIVAAPNAEPPPIRIVDAVVHDGRLVALYENHRVVVWNLEKLNVDPDWTESLTARKAIGIENGATGLWTYDGAIAASWLPTKALPPETIKSPGIDEPLIKMLEIGNELYAVFPTEIIALRAQKKFPVPASDGQLRATYLRALTVTKHHHDIWIGTGNGEWGGQLVKFDTLSGRWFSQFDSLHYVTGIAPFSDDNIWVSWSMSHMDASTVIKIHGPDAKPIKTHSEWRGHYYQTIAYSEFDHVIYAIEQFQLGTIDRNGLLHDPINLGRIRYSPEPNAVGVAPGVLKILPLGPHRLVIVLFNASPLLFANGKIERFEEPPLFEAK